MTTINSNITISFFKKKEFFLFSSFLISIIGLVGWIIGSDSLSAGSSFYIPMAPATGVSFILISMLIYLNIIFPNSNKQNIFAQIISVLISLFCIYILLKYLFDFNIDLEELFLKKPEKLNQVLKGRMSPITAILFLLSCANVLLIKQKNIIFLNRLKDLLSSIIFISSFILLLGYLYKAPLLYGSSFIPVALPTAICFFLISFTLIRVNDFFFGFKNINTIHKKLLKSFLPLIVIAIIIQGYFNVELFLKTQNPSLISALLLLITIILCMIVTNKISSSISMKLTKAERQLKEKNEEIEAQNEEFIQINEELLERNNEYSALNEEYISKNEDLRNSKEKAEESERLKSAFLANMSHEIRTPLNIITGYSEFLSEENLTKAERAEYINLVNKNSIRLMSLINNILDLSRIESGQKIVEFKDFNINKLVDEIFEQHKKTVEGKQLELIVQKGLESEQAIINSSEQLIYQIFTNLINNALKYSLEGKIVFGYNINENEIELFVSDTGIGISKEYSSNLFKRFSQENSSLRRTYEGAGLGLAIVKGIVDLMKGTINVSSEKGKGTTFKIILTLNKTSAKSENSKSHILEKRHHDKQITLLIVEDDETSFHLLKKQILREFTCEIIHAINGNRAIEKVKEHPEITCVLMDLHLPDIDGCETTVIIKKLKKDLPVFAVTAAVMDEDKQAAFKAGCDDFFSKPVDRVKLYKLILEC